MRAIVIIILVLLLPGSSPVCLAGAQSAHTSPMTSEYSFQMPYAPAAAHNQLMTRLANLADPMLRRRYRLMIEFGASLFPPDEQIEVDAVRRGGLGIDLHRWLHLNPGERRFDLVVLPDVDYFWPADIQPGRYRPLYSTAFILHMEPAAEGKTTVHVLQINSIARYGKKFDLLGRTGPKFYWDDRPVLPSPQAAREMIGHLTGAAR